MPDKLQALYDNLSKMNPDFKVSLDQFRQDMQDENKLKTLHTNLGKNYPDFKVGYDQFKSDMWSTNPQPSGPTAPAAPENPTPRGMVFPDLTPAGLSFQEKSLTVPGAVSAVLPTTVPEVQPTMETVGASKLAASPLNVFENKVVSPGVQQTEVANPEDYFKEGIKETAGAAMPTEKPSFASKMGKSFGWGLTAGSASTGSWIADTPGFIYNLAGAPFRAVGLDVPRAEDFKGGALEQVSNYYKKQAAAYENKLTAMNPGRERGIQGAFSSGDLGGGILNLTESIAQSLPASIAMMLSGGATLPTILSGTAVFGAGKAQEMAKLAPQMNADKRDFVAAINGTLEGVFETWLGSGAVAKALTDVVKKEGADAAKGQIKNSLRTIFTKAITDNPWLAPLGEGFEEVGTQLAQNLVDKYSGYKPNLNITDGVADSMWAGVGMGGLHGAAIGLAKAAVADQKKAQFVNARAQAAQTVQQNFQQLAQPDGNLHIGTNKNGNEVVIVSQTPGGMAILQDGTIADISDISDIQLHPFESLFGQQMAEFDAANDPDLQPQEAPQVQATFNWNGRTMQLTDVSDKNDLMVQEIDNEGEPVGRPEKISSEEYRKILEQQVTAPDATAELRTYDIGGKSVPFTPEANGNLTSEAFNSPEEVEAAKTDLEKQIGAENDIAVNKVPGPDNMSPATYTISITPKMGDTFDQLFEKPGEVKPKKDITEQLFAKEGEQPASYMLNGQPIERGKAMARVKAAIFDGNRKKIDNLEVSGDKEMTDMIDKAFPVKMTIGKKKASMEDALNWIDSADNLDELHKLKIEGAPATSDIRTAYVMKVKELVPEITPEESDKMLSELFVKEEPEQKVEEPIKTEENDSRNSTRIPSGEPRREATEQAGPDKTRGGSETAAGGNVQGNGQVEQAARETEQVGGTEVRAEDQRQETVAEKPGLKKPSFQRKKKVSPSKLVDLYKTRLTKLKKENPHTYWSVDLPSDADLLSAAEDGRLIDMAGGMAYVTKDGDLKGLFKYDPEAHGTAKALQAERIKMGGIKLDAYDTEGTGEVSLVPTYKKNGFREVARVDFNPEYAPEDMPKDIKDMNPDIVVMVYDPENKLDIKERRFNKDQYEDALAYRDSYVTEEPVPDHNKSADTQAFFSDVVTGTSDKFKPNKPWEPILKFSAKEEAVRPVFEKFNGNFDTHIATSIPAFRDVQIKVVSALNQMFGKKGGLIYDIGGSEGGFVKSITELSDGRMKSINLDANGDMEAVHNATPVEGSEFVKEAFGEGFEWDGVTYPRHEPKQKADVVHESMTFQFIDEKRADKVEEVVNNYLKPDGLFISEEKVHPASQKQWAANEAKKDKDFKSRYYEAGQISAKKEEVLTGMVTNQTTYDRYKNELRKKFDYVEEYWDGGNFKGLVASNDKAKVDQFLTEVGNTDTEFSEKNIKPITNDNEKGQSVPSFKRKRTGDKTNESTNSQTGAVDSGSIAGADTEELDSIEQKVIAEAELTNTELASEEILAVAAVAKMNPGITISDILNTYSVGKKAGSIVTKEPINTKPAGYEITAPSQSYNSAVAEKAKGSTGNNLWVRNSQTDSNTDRILLVQFKPKATSINDPQANYFRGLYRYVPGYDRTSDFWEVPAWMGRIAAMEPNSDVYIVRNTKEASDFVAKAGYGKVLFSAMDVVKNDILNITKANPDQEFQIGTYTTFEEVKDLKNVKTFKSIEEYADTNKTPLKYSYDYSNFEGTAVIPRLRTSEGCNFKCAFCSNVLPVKALTEEDIMTQVDNIKFLDSKLVYIGDKAFGQANNRDVISKIYATLKRYNPDFEGFIVQTSAADFANKKIFSKDYLDKAHIKYVELGIETYNDDILASLNKRHSSSKYANAALDNARENNIKVIPNVIVGLTWKDGNGNLRSENKSTYENTLNWLKANSDVISHINVYALAIYDNTEIADSIETRLDSDTNENIVAKSFHEDKKVHEWAMDEFTKFGIAQIKKYQSKPFSLNTLIKEAAAETDTNPTEAQIEAGNYRMGHVNIQGMDISIENPKGSTRSGTDEDGKAWETTMKSHYGYFKGSIGKDGDHIDVFIGPKPANETIYVVDQNNPATGEFDESKVMLGYDSAEQAKEAYLANYEPGWKGFGTISEVPVEKFKTWLYDGARQRKPFSEYVEVKRPVSFQAKKLYAGLETVPKFKNLVELTGWLQKWSKKNKVFASEEAKSDDDKFVKALVKHTIEELKALEELSEYPYLGFYDYDIPTRLNPELQRFGFKRYGHELSPSEIALYHLVSGFASPSADPVMDSSKGLDVFDRYMKTGELSGRSDMQATIWEVNEASKRVDTGKPKFDEQGNPVYSQVTRAFASRSLDKFRDNVLAHFDGDLNKSIDWISSRHSYEDISKMMGTPLKGKGALTEHENFTKEDGGFGIFGFTGPKLGSYVLNRIGNFSTVTKDLWYARTMARLTGESLQEKTGKALKLPWAVTVEGKRKRALADKAWGIVADKLGITPADVQQRMWEFEKRLYEKIGASGASGTTGYASEGFLKRAKQLEPALYEPFEPAKPAYKKRSVEVDGVQANDPELQSNLTKWEEESSMRTPVHILGNEAAADAIRGTTTPEFEQDVRDTEFWGMTHNGEIYIHPETPSDFAILTWAHEKSHLVYESGFENYKQEKTFSEDLFDSLGVAEIRRVLPVEYWFDDKAQQAKEYLAMLVEDVVTQGGLIESAPDFVKSIIFDQINEFSSVKYLQDEKQRLDNRGQEPVTSETVGQGVSETTGNRPGEKDTGGPSVSTTPKGKQEINKIFSFEDLFEPSFKKAPETIEVDGVERPTLNSNGQPIHSTEEGIKNFWKWFGDSKVVDENGRPLVVYHGTAKNFEDFQVNKGDLGAHFGNIDQANQISRNNPENSSVLPVYLQLENPIRLNDEGYFESKIIAGQLLDKGLINIEEHDKLAYASKHWRQLNEMSSELLQKLGFDGVVYLNRREGIPAIEKLAASDEGPEEIRSMVGLSDEEFKTKYPEAKDSYIVLNPTQIKSATGNEGGFDPNDPRISFKRKAALKPERKQVQTTGEKIREILVNNKLALENWMKDVQTVVPKIEDYENPLLKDALAKSKVTNRLRIFEKGAYKNLINSITNVLKTSGISKEELSHYLIAVHGVERNEKFWNNNPDRVGEDFSGLTELKEIVRSQASPAEQLVIDGMNNEDFAKYYQKQIEDKAQPSQIKALWNSIRAISKLVRDEMLDSGMISREYYDELNTMYKNYIPLRAWEDPNPEDFEFSRGVGSYTEPIIRAKGRKSLAEDPLATLLQMANTAYISGERNRVKQAAGELVRNNATALKDVVQYNRTYFVTQGTDAQGNPIIQETIDRPDQTLFDQGLVSTKVPKAYTTRRTSAQAKEFEVEFYRGGKKYVLVFQGSDPAVARAINNREASVGLDYLNKVVGTDIKIGKVTIPSITKMSRYLSSINTTYSVDFPLVNFVRDAPMAMLSEWAYGDAKEVAKMFPNMKRAEAAMRRMLRGKAKPATNADDAMLEDFFAAGGPTGFAFLKNVDEFKQSIANDVRKINRIKNPFVRMEVGFRKGLDLIGQLGEWSETITRFGVYINHVEAGDSKEISALAAKNATVNFDQKGRISPALNGLYTFFNAAVQAVDKYFKLWGRNPYKMAGIHMFLVVQGFINALMLDLFGGEDDDKIKNYDKVSDYTKRNNIVIPIPGSDKTVSLAVPQILRKFHAIGFDAYDLLSGRKTAEQVMLDELASIPSDVSPIDTDAFLNKEGDISVKPLVPSILRPIVELEANENFMKMPIVPEPFSIEMAHKIADTRRAYKDVNKIAQWTTDQLYKLGGGDETGFKYVYDNGELLKVPALLDISPESIEHLFESYFGGVGKFANRTWKTTGNIFNAGQKLYEGENFREAIKEIDLNTVPVANRFVRTPVGDPLEKEFRKVRNDMENKIKVLDQAEKDQDWTKFDRMYKEIGGKINDYKVIMTTFENLDKTYNVVSKENKKAAEEIKTEMREQMKEIVKLK